MKVQHQMPSGVFSRDLPELVSVDKANRTIEIVWSTGFEGFRRTWEGGYWESLSLDATHVNLSRLKAGAPVLDTHSRYELRSIIGVVEDAWLVSPTEARAKLRFSDREDIRGLVNDIMDGIIRNISVGYSVKKLVEVGKRDGYPQLRAEDWEPFELSFVPVPFDAGAQSRSNDSEIFSDCTIILERENPMILENGQVPTTPSAPVVDNGEAIRAAIEGEKQRTLEIYSTCEKAGLERSVAEKFVTDNVAIDAVRKFAIDQVAERNKAPAVNPVVKAGELNENSTLVRAIEESILHRANPAVFELTELARRYSSHSFLDMARDFISSVGMNTQGLNRNEIAGRALQHRGLHTTSDFPGILGSSVKKILAGYYKTAPADYRYLVRDIGMTDYKAVNRYGLSQGPALLEVKEHGEYTRGSLAEQAEAMQLKKYGRILGITREMIINDDMGALNDIPRMWAFAVSQLQQNLVFQQLINNPLMGDGFALFSAQHNNLMTASALTDANLQLAITALETQTGFSAPGEDVQYMALKAKYLIVGPSQKYTALKLTTAITSPQSVSAINLFSDLQVKVDPRITGTKWYVAADSSQVDLIGLMYLIGEQGPQLDERLGFDVDGVEFKVRLDTGAKVLDHRGFVYNPGL